MDLLFSPSPELASAYIDYETEMGLFIEELAGVLQIGLVAGMSLIYGCWTTMETRTKAPILSPAVPESSCKNTHTFLVFANKLKSYPWLLKDVWPAKRSPQCC